MSGIEFAIGKGSIARDLSKIESHLRAYSLGLREQAVEAIDAVYGRVCDMLIYSAPDILYYSIECEGMFEITFVVSSDCFQPQDIQVGQTPLADTLEAFVVKRGNEIHAHRIRSARTDLQSMAFDIKRTDFAKAIASIVAGARHGQLAAASLAAVDSWALVEHGIDDGGLQLSLPFWGNSSPAASSSRFFAAIREQETEVHVGLKATAQSMHTLTILASHVLDAGCYCEGVTIAAFEPFRPLVNPDAVTGKVLGTMLNARGPAPIVIFTNA